MIRFARIMALTASLTTLSSLGAIASPTLPLPPPSPMMRPPQPEPLLTVIGEGTVSKPPDEAKLSLQIITDDANVTASTSKNNAVQNALKARLSFLQCKGCDALRETGYGVTFIPYPPKNLPPEERQPRYGYVTTRSILVTITPIDLIGRVIDAAAATGITDIGDMRFDLKESRSAYMNALSAAVHDAKQQADTLAAAGSFHIVRVRTVTTGYSSIQASPNMAPLPLRAEAKYASIPTEILPSGPVDVNARVTITYSIE
jgi:uncharacterized protein